MPQLKPVPATLDDPHREWFTSAEAMFIVRLGERQLREVTATKELHAHQPARPGSRLRYHRDCLRAFLAARPCPHLAPAGPVRGARKSA